METYINEKKLEEKQYNNIIFKYLLRNYEHRNFSAILARIEYLFSLVLWRVETFHFHLPEHLKLF